MALEVIDKRKIADTKWKELATYIKTRIFPKGIRKIEAESSFQSKVIEGGHTLVLTLSPQMFEGRWFKVRLEPASKDKDTERFIIAGNGFVSVDLPRHKKGSDNKLKVSALHDFRAEIYQAILNLLTSKEVQRLTKKKPMKKTAKKPATTMLSLAPAATH